MDTKTFSHRNSFNSHRTFFKFIIVTVLFTGFFSISQRVNAQVTVLWEELLFAPTQPDNTPSSYLKSPALGVDAISLSKDMSFDQDQEQTIIPLPVKDNRRKNYIPNIQLSPNPISSQTTIIKDPEVILKSLVVVDVQGNVRFSEKFVSGPLQIPYLETGYYNFRVYTNLGVASKLIYVNPS